MSERRSTGGGKGWVALLAAALLLPAAGAPARADAPPESIAAPVAGPGPAPLKKKIRPSDPDLADFLDAAERFELNAEDFRKDVALVIAGKYKEKRAEVERSYDGKIKSEEGEESKRRDDAIARFEDFLRRYPSDPKYTPDAIFRLAELYFEKSQTEYLALYEKFLDEDKKWSAGGAESEPTEPAKDYARTIELYQWLVRDFPDYRLIDGAYYLMAYCQGEEGKFEESKNTYLKLVYKAPGSKFAAEAWTRVGEYYFDMAELPEALEAYKKAIDLGEGRYYDKALYKLAWTYYRMDDFDSAIKTFLTLVDYADKHEHDEGKPGAVLRPESIEYLAISIAEEDWDLDGTKDSEVDPKNSPLGRAARYLDPKIPRSFEVYRALGEILAVQTKYKEAVAVWKRTIELFPYNPDSPKVESLIIDALKADRDFDSMIAEREKLVRMYGEDSAWAKGPDGIAGTADDMKRSAVNDAAKLAEEGFIEAATFHHNAGQVLKKKWLVEKTKDLFDKFQAEYALAAELYEKYLEKYGETSRNAYDIEFYLAECLYYSGKWLPAAKHYEAVRDSPLDNKYFEESAFSAIDAYINFIDEEFRAGRLDKKATLAGMEETAKKTGVDPDGSGVGVTPEPIPEILGALNKDRDFFVTNVSDPTNKEIKVDALAYHAALVYYEYKDYAEASKRFRAIAAKWPDKSTGGFSAKLVIEICRVLGDLDCVENESDKLETAATATGAGKTSVFTAEDAKAFKDAKFAAKFKKAMKAFEGKNWEVAAESFLKLAEERKPGEWSARDKALNNAAVAYENAFKYESALKVYRKLATEHPDSEFAMPALYRVALNSDRFFEYEEAVGEYESLYAKYGATKKETPEVTESLLSAGLLSEALGDYDKAARLFEKYYATYPGTKEAPDVLFRTAKVYEKSKKWPEAIKTYRKYIADWGKEPARSASIIESFVKIGDAYEEMGKHKEALAAYKEAVRAYDERGLKSGEAAAEFAARAAFTLVEEELKVFEKVVIDAKDVKALGKNLEKKATALKEMEGKYKDVWRFGRPDWTLASFYRLGYLYEDFKNKIAAVKNPFTEKCEKKGGVYCDAVDEYQNAIDDMTTNVEDKAVAAYTTAVTKARELGVSNKWTKLALEFVNKFKPTDFPLTKDDKILYEDTDFTSPPMETPR
ncbi:MAG TPA: tetratricopeptide repeat protein [Myxococcota bacterium]|jgi:tetratricopeptide (TPR) repeat protein|nr:tetratricopeptide repeat protein [Myxococcota bacterium]